MKHLANMRGCTSPKVPNPIPKCQLLSINIKEDKNRRQGLTGLDEWA